MDDKKFLIGIGIVSVVLLIGGYFLATRQEDRLSKPLLGDAVSVSEYHVPVGTKIKYNSNPPAGGNHYGESTVHAGFYDKPIDDGYIVHSLEHGAAILWYDPKLLNSSQFNDLKAIFSQQSGKAIMMPRSSMDVPVALSSWGRVLKLKTIDKKQISAFFETNLDRSPEQAPI